MDKDGIRQAVRDDFMGMFLSSSDRPAPTHPSSSPILTGISPSTLASGILYPLSLTLFSDIFLPRSCGLLLAFVP